MKHNLISAVLIGCVLTASVPAYAKDPCETVLCMWGKLQGENPSECSSAVGDYFDIIKKKHGDIRWSSTANARQQFLDSCSQADPDKTKMINDKFGRMRG
ncbi:TrbM protein [Pseudomonas duriflava]|uniref:TrbM protein n=1 Tax=Pseudomonas duriflava TaxID=459528 RepID=A0A562PPQ7_9PSED|nr:TrbM/KikA/MpfK family conjugal transfer protein [Pseudomonas duriflava]TWI46170.1 TrbM protein [Pseudomonas duriflava]